MVVQTKLGSPVHNCGSTSLQGRADNDAESAGMLELESIALFISTAMCSSIVGFNIFVFCSVMEIFSLSRFLDGDKDGSMIIASDVFSAWFVDMRNFWN